MTHKFACLLQNPQLIHIEKKIIWREWKKTYNQIWRSDTLRELKVDISSFLFGVSIFVEQQIFEMSSMPTLVTTTQAHNCNHEANDSSKNKTTTKTYTLWPLMKRKASEN